MTAHPRLAGPVVLMAILALGVAIQPVYGQAQSASIAQEFETLHFRSIGPATMSGRISDLAVFEADPAIYYVGTAHGGVWKTTSNGALFEPLLQDQGLISIGDVTVSQIDANLVWVGTGEANNRQSSSFGGGIYKSTDGGETFQFMGLPNSRHIGRIAIHPTNNDIVLVAAVGPLYGSGGERGIYKTTNGGQTWTRVLFVDDDTGAIDLVMAKTDPNVVYASTYQRRRSTCCFNGGGPGSGIWKSTDGGDTWTRLSNGLPQGALGRIALDVFQQSANVVYALVQAAGGGGRGGGGGGGDDEPGSGVYRSDDGGQNWRQVGTTNPRPMYFSQVRIDPRDPNRLVGGGVGLHMSIDGGASFETDAAQAIHDDVHAIWIDPDNPRHILIGNDGGLAVTYDRSSTWTFLTNLPVGLFYHVSYDLERPYNVCGGMQDNYNWCGPSAARQNRGIMNYDWFQIQGGDGFHAIPDKVDSRIIYTESQNGNMTRRNKVTGESKNIRPNASNVTNADDDNSYRWNWDTPLLISPNDPGVLFAAANRVFRSTDRGDSWTVISPEMTKNQDRGETMQMGVRNADVNISRNDGVNWPTIFSLAESPRQAGVLYVGTDDGVVSVTRDGGRNWQDVTGNIPGFPDGGFVSEVVPSAFANGRVYVTVDDHLENDYEPHIWVSEDYGATFRSIVGSLRGENVRTLTEDQRNQDVLYIGTETGIFLSLDRGQSWRRLKANLPTVRIDEITLHPRDNAMLVATHGRSLWILDHLEPIQEYTATQAANATLFTVPTALQWKSLDNRNDEFWGHGFFAGENPPTEAVIQYSLRGAATNVAMRITDSSGRVVRELEAAGNRLQAGIQTLCWDQRLQPIEEPDFTAGPAGGRGGAAGGRAGGAAGGRGGRGGGGANIPGVPSPMPESGYMPSDPCGGGGGGGGGRGGGGGSAGPYVLPGTYSVAMTVNGNAAGTKQLEIVMDPEVQLTGGERRRYNQILEDLHDLQQRGTIAQAALEALMAQMPGVAQRVASASNVPAATKTQFQQLNDAFDAVRVRFGVEPPPDPNAGGGGRGGRGGGRGGGGGDPEDMLARAASVKGSIMSLWETPSNSLVSEYNTVRSALPQAISQANNVLSRARTVASALNQYGITLTVPDVTLR